MTHVQVRSRAPVVIELISSLAIACEADRPTALKSASIQPSLTVTSEICALDRPDNIGYPPPDSGTVCGIHFTMDEPWLNCTVWTSIRWITREPGYPYADAPASRFYANEYNAEQNGPLDVRFSSPVKNVTVGLMRMNYDTHYMVAFNGAGQEIGQKTFVRSPPDTLGESWAVETLAVNGIKKVLIYPAWSGAVRTCQAGSDKAKDAGVWYSLTFEPDTTCPPVGDSVIDNKDFRTRYDSLMKLSKISNPNPASREEWHLFAYRNSTTGETLLGNDFFTSHLPCNTIFEVPPNIPGYAPIGVIHSHVHFQNENIKVACNNPLAKPYDATYNGGGSDADWGAADSGATLVYAVGPEYTAKLVPDTPPAERGSNPFIWQKNSDQCWSGSQI
jgi:hypothetical protein